MGTLGYSVTSTCAHKCRKQHLFKEPIWAEERRCFGFVCHLYNLEPLQEKNGISRIFSGCIVSHAILTERMKSVDQYLYQWFSDKCLCFLPTTHSASPSTPTPRPHLALLYILEAHTLGTLVATSHPRFHLSWCQITLFYALPVSFQKVFFSTCCHSWIVTLIPLSSLSSGPVPFQTLSLQCLTSLA